MGSRRVDHLPTRGALDPLFGRRRRDLDPLDGKPTSFTKENGEVVKI
jgi:hypothetical protein